MTTSCCLDFIVRIDWFSRTNVQMCIMEVKWGSWTKAMDGWMWHLVYIRVAGASVRLLVSCLVLVGGDGGVGGDDGGGCILFVVAFNGHFSNATCHMSLHSTRSALNRNKEYDLFEHWRRWEFGLAQSNGLEWLVRWWSSYFMAPETPERVHLKYIVFQQQQQQQKIYSWWSPIFHSLAFYLISLLNLHFTLFFMLDNHWNKFK